MSQNIEDKQLQDDRDNAGVEQEIEAALGLGGEAIPVVLDPKKSSVVKKRRGFAAMDPKRVSEIAAKGGKAAHAAGTAHEFTKEEAAAAGRLGGFATHAKRTGHKNG